MNRAERRSMMRQAQKGSQLLAKYNKQQRIDALLKNGITIKDLEDNFEQGREVGFVQATKQMRKTCYAAMCLALHDELGFDAEQCCDVLKNMDDKVAYCLDNAELVEEVFEKTGLQIDLDDTFDRVRLKELEAQNGDVQNAV